MTNSLNVIIHRNPKIHMCLSAYRVQNSSSKMESFEILYSVALTWNVEKENIPKYTCGLK